MLAHVTPCIFRREAATAAAASPLSCMNIKTLWKGAIFAAAALACAIAIFANAASQLSAQSPHAGDDVGRLLYFTLSAGYRHEAIPLSAQILAEIGTASPRFEVTHSEDVSVSRRTCGAMRP